MVARLTKRQRRQLRQKGKLEEVESRKVFFKIKEIEPLTYNQERVFDAFEDSKNVLLRGKAGTGKTFIALYLALDEVINGNGDCKQVLIYRSMVPSRDAGFLPGDPRQKASVYETPYVGICNELFGRGDAYETLKRKKLIEFETTSWVRGININDSIVIIDEFQNMDFGELYSLITRMGKNTQILICGDDRAQSDFRGRDVYNRIGVSNFIEVLENMEDDFSIVEFDVDDIVRSGLVKRFIIAADQLGYTP